MSITHQKLLRLYEDCRWNTSDLPSNLRRVHGPLGHIYEIHFRKLLEMQSRFVRMLMDVTHEALRSVQPDGVPWFLLRYDSNRCPWGSLHDVDMLIALGLSVGYISLFTVKVPDISGLMLYSYIENNRIAASVNTDGRKFYIRGLKEWGKYKI